VHAACLLSLLVIWQWGDRIHVISQQRQQHALVDHVCVLDHGWLLVRLPPWLSRPSEGSADKSPEAQQAEVQAAMNKQLVEIMSKVGPRLGLSRGRAAARLRSPPCTASR
jgi:hypothetical protein